MRVAHAPRLVPGQVWATEDGSAHITIIGRAGAELGGLVRSDDTTATAVPEHVIRSSYRLVADDIQFHID